MAQQVKNLFRVKPWFDYQGDVYRHQRKQGYCGVCGKKTNYKSVYAVEYCCSEECSRELWYDIFLKLLTDRKRGK
jgi:hypothetical protein